MIRHCDCNGSFFGTKERIPMEHLSKLLLIIKKHPLVFLQADANCIFGLTTTQIKDLKKFAVENNLIKQSKKEFFLTEAGEKYLSENPLQSWIDEVNFKRPEINLEYLKLDKAPPTLTKATRLLARHLLDGEVLKENSTEHYLVKDLLCSKSTCIEVKKEIEGFVLSDGEQRLTCLFERFMSAPYGLTKSIIAILLLDILVKNKDVLAIYENLQFQLKLTPLMFDRMICCPQNFTLRKTQIDDMPILEDISKIILPRKSKNILDLTKGLIFFIRNLDKYTLSTERLNKPALRFRNAVLNAKDPISLFYRDIPKVLDDKILCQCGESFVKSFESAVDELQNCYINLIKELKAFLFESFNEAERTSLAERFEAVKEYLGDSDLKILHNNINEAQSTDNLWIERIATFVNKSRVPKDWSDSDVADFKVKVKEFALKFQTIEATVGASEVHLDSTMTTLIGQLLKLNKPQQIAIVKKVINL